MAKDKEDSIDLLEDKRFVKKLQATFDLWLEKELKPLKEQIAQLEQQKNNVPQVTFSGFEVLNQEKKLLEEQLAKNQVKLYEANDKLAAKLKENQALKDLLNRLEVQKNEAEMLLAKLQEEFQAEKQSKIELQKALEKQLKKAGRSDGRITSFSTANCPPPRSRAAYSRDIGTCVNAAEQIFVVVGSCLKSILARTMTAVPVSFSGA